MSELLIVVVSLATITVALVQLIKNILSSTYDQRDNDMDALEVCRDENAELKIENARLRLILQQRRNKVK